MTKIAVLVDWTQTFVDVGASFYGGATEEEKDKACTIIEKCDKILNFCDVHTKESKEFICNGGLYPPHALVDEDLSFVEQNGSCRLTKKLQDKIAEKKLKGGIVIPNNVIYQTPDHPIPVEYITKTFDNLPVIEKPSDTSYDYMVSAKQFFNGTQLQNLPFGDNAKEFSAANIIQHQYGKGEGLTFYVTGVVTGICIIHTASGLKQMFPKAKVVIVKDACHPLIGEMFGITSVEQNDMVVKALCTQIGILYQDLKDVEF